MIRQAPRSALALITVVLLCSCSFQAHAQKKTSGASNPKPPSPAEFPSAWKNLVYNITPFSIDVAVLAGPGSQRMKQIAHLYMEFTDSKRIFQHTSFKEPIPFEYRSFSSGANAIIHDLKMDSFLYVPSQVIPVSIFSLEKSAESFFQIVRFEAVEPEIFDRQGTYVLKITVGSIDISPGVSITDMKGHLWINSKTGRPVKLVLLGKADMLSDEITQLSLLVDFHYGRMTVDADSWKSINAAMLDFRNGRDTAAEAAVRKVEKRAAAKMTSLQIPE